MLALVSWLVRLARLLLSLLVCAALLLAGVWHLLRDRLLAALVRRLLNAKLGAWAGYGDEGAVSIAWIALSAPGFPASFELTASKLVWRNPRGGDGQAAYATPHLLRLRRLRVSIQLSSLARCVRADAPLVVDELELSGVEVIFERSTGGGGGGAEKTASVAELNWWAALGYSSEPADAVLEEVDGASAGAPRRALHCELHVRLSRAATLDAPALARADGSPPSPYFELQLDDDAATLQRSTVQACTATPEWHEHFAFDEPSVRGRSQLRIVARDAASAEPRASDRVLGTRIMDLRALHAAAPALARECGGAHARHQLAGLDALHAAATALARDGRDGARDVILSGGFGLGDRWGDQSAPAIGYHDGDDGRPRFWMRILLKPLASGRAATPASGAAPRRVLLPSTRRSKALSVSDNALAVETSETLKAWRARVTAQDSHLRVRLLHLRVATDATSLRVVVRCRGATRSIIMSPRGEGGDGERLFACDDAASRLEFDVASAVGNLDIEVWGQPKLASAHPRSADALLLTARTPLRALMRPARARASFGARGRAAVACAIAALLAWLPAQWLPYVLAALCLLSRTASKLAAPQDYELFDSNGVVPRDVRLYPPCATAEGPCHGSGNAPAGGATADDDARMCNHFDNDDYRSIHHARVRRGKSRARARSGGDLLGSGSDGGSDARIEFTSDLVLPRGTAREWHWGLPCRLHVRQAQVADVHVWAKDLAHDLVGTASATIDDDGRQSRGAGRHKWAHSPSMDPGPGDGQGWHTAAAQAWLRAQPEPLTLRSFWLDEADLDEPGADGVYLNELVLRHLLPAVRGELMRRGNLRSALSVGASLSRQKIKKSIMKANPLSCATSRRRAGANAPGEQTRAES